MKTFIMAGGRLFADRTTARKWEDAQPALEKLKKQIEEGIGESSSAENFAEVVLKTILTDRDVGKTLAALSKSVRTQVDGRFLLQTLNQEPVEMPASIGTQKKAAAPAKTAAKKAAAPSKTPTSDKKETAPSPAGKTPARKTAAKKAAAPPPAKNDQPPPPPPAPAAASQEDSPPPPPPPPPAQ